MLTIHHLAMSQSERVVWLCEELGLDYRLVRYERTSAMAAPAEYKALHPAGTAPTIEDGGVVLAESGAVFAYILAKYGDGRLACGPEDADFAEYLFWLHFANGTIMPSQIAGLVLRSLGVTAGNPLSDGVVSRVAQAEAMMEARLTAAPFLGGANFTAADIMNLFALTTLAIFAPRDLGPFPHLRAYIARIRQRPAYLRAMALAEPNRAHG